VRAKYLERLVGSPDDPWSSPSAWRPVVVDADQPLRPLAVEGASHLWVTVLASGKPIGTLLLPAEADPLPAQAVAAAISRDLCWELHRERMRASFAGKPLPRHVPRSTVLVCTKNRPDHLRACLTSISRLERPVDEILVVDNGSHPDETRAITTDFGARYVREPLPGLDRARNRGVAEASGEVVLCTDDDVEVDPHWAAALLACFDDPLVMAAGGLVLPASLDTPARWHFERHVSFARGFDRRVLDGSIAPPSLAGSTGAGASMALRLDFVRSIGGFPEELDAGMPTESGGDTYMFYRVLRDGFRIVYEPAALALHSHRSTASALEQVFGGYGTGVWSWAIRALVHDRDPVTSAKVAAWASDYLGRKVAGSLIKRAGALPLRVSIAGVRGALAAPGAYRAARRVVAERPPVFVGAPRSRLLAGSAGEAPAWLAAAPPMQLRRSSARSLSVVIASQGRRGSLGSLLDALASQDFPEDHLEVLVVLDRDSADAIAMAAEMPCRRPPRVIRLDSGVQQVGEDDCWAAAARNQGAAAATGDVLLFLDDDVVPTSAAFLSAHLHAHSGGAAAVVGPSVPSLEGRSGMLERQARNWLIDQSERLLRAKKLAYTDLEPANLSIRRSVFDESGGFASLPCREGWELGYRLARAGVTVCAAPGATMHCQLDDDLGRAIDNARLEGVGDVAFARLHPEVLFHLPLGALAEAAPSRQRLARLGLEHGDAALAMIHGSQPLLPLFERAGMCQLFVDHLSRIRFLAYWSGVGSSVEGVDGWAALVGSSRAASIPAPEFELRDPVGLPDLDRACEVVIHERGVPLGSAPVSWGGVPWNRRVFMERVVERFADLAHDVDVCPLTIAVDEGDGGEGLTAPALGT